MRFANNVSETTTSIAGTSGDGAVTLTQRTGLPRFSTVFGSAALTVRYVIRKSDNTKFESGIGSVSSNVLTRTLPQVTWDGTTWDDSSPSPVQFGSTPTSGDVLIEMSATAETIGAGVIDARQSSVAGDSTWRDYPISGHIGQWSTSGNGVALTADREHYFCYLNEYPGRLTGIQFEVTAAVASSNMKLALFDLGSAGLPVNKICDFVTTSTASTGVKTDTATGSWSPAGPIFLSPGWLAIGFIASHAISIRMTTSVGTKTRHTPFGRKDGYGMGDIIYVSGSYASGLPSAPSFGSATMSGAASISGAWIGLKVQP